MRARATTIFIIGMTTALVPGCSDMVWGKDESPQTVAIPLGGGWRVANGRAHVRYLQPTEQMSRSLVEGVQMGASLLVQCKDGGEHEIFALQDEHSPPVCGIRVKLLRMKHSPREAIDLEVVWQE